MTQRRVAVLSLQARTDTFVGDESTAAAASVLEDAGNDVRILRRTRGAETDEEWHESITTFVRSEPFDVAVLVRAWDGATVAAVRRGLAPSARVLRLGTTSSAALDSDFDAVVNRDGLVPFLDGIAPSGLGLPTTKVLRSLPLAPTAIEIAHSVEGERPTIRGPMVGCPFLLDARKQPAFASLDPGPGVQMKGCSFCLDNIGAYVAPPPDEVVAAWLSQLRAARVHNADVREVLLIDERPHPYLPALFTAIAAEPALYGLELLIKSRVDWLFEHEAEVVSAIELARASKSVLHLYLVGFESFDPDQLSLFNKGVTVEQNVAAIAKMRELGERYPDAFEYRRYRAHGIVLFTPWTTPESLLLNARAMREVRFAELRTESLRTRLRLYPRTPLHALAARDGLLTETFAGGRTDRATEQGYDASAPWRFADPRVEAIFRAATEVHAAVRTLDESDVLEAAVALVERYPAIASEPSLAALPLLQAVEEERALRGTPRVRVGPLVPSSRRVRVAAGAEAVATAYRAMGLAAVADGELVHVAMTDDDLRALRESPRRPELPRALLTRGGLAPHRLERVLADGDCHRLLLDDDPPYEIRVRAHDPRRAHVLRYGQFAIDIDEPGALGPRQRDALRALVTALARP